MDNYLLITIDTEEDMPKWRPEKVTTVKNIYALPKISEMFRRYSVRPTYLVDRPVLEDNTACKIIKKLSSKGICEIGMHLHSWNTPPVMSEEYQGKATVLNLYSKEIQEQKITELHNYFIKQLGFAPTSYRAGRYGLTLETLELLAGLGYKADSSVAPLINYSSYGAPDYKNHKHIPFWIKTSANKKILEIPITIGFVGCFPRSFYNVYSAIPDWTHIKGIMYRLNIARLIWLRPTNYNYKEMRQLIDFITDKGDCDVFNMMFHSSELCPGASPYNQSENDVSQFIERMSEIIQYLTKEHGAIGVTLSEFAEIAASRNYPAKVLTI